MSAGARSIAQPARLVERLSPKQHSRPVVASGCDPATIGTDRLARLSARPTAARRVGERKDRNLTGMAQALFSLDNLKLRYEPFPIGLAKPIMSEEQYGRFLDAWPPSELFQYLPKVGHKYSLSEKYNPKQYHDWVESHQIWRDFRDWIKSDEFVWGVLDTLEERHIDLGFKRLSRAGRLKRNLKNLIRGKWWKAPPQLSARFEFSMLPADGGCVTPHTDNPDKIVTMVVSMAREGEWDPAYGGGTEVNRHRKPELSFNRMNDKAEFEDMETLETYEFEPNQCVLFVKTFNSWHCVRPMRGPKGAMRRTLTINIETSH
jgi:hypothetical protein